MKKSRFLLAPIFALFDFKLYKEVRDLPASKAFLYLTYLSGLFTLFFLFAGIFNAPKADAFVDWIQKEFKGITISRDGMRLDQPGRFELNHPKWGPIAVFDDTRPRINPSEMGPYLIYMTSKMVYVKRNGSVQTNPIGSRAEKDFKTHIDGPAIRKVYDRLKVPVFSFLLLVIFVIGFLTRLATAVVFAVIGQLIQLAVPRGLRFDALFLLASFAISVGVVFSLLQMIPALAPFFLGPVAALLGFVYFIIAIFVQPKPTSVNS